MDEATLEKLKLQWKTNILETVAIKSYTTAFSLLHALQLSRTLPQESAFEVAVLESHRMLLAETEDWKNRTYQAFFSDPSVPDAERPILAEELAHFVEQMQASLVPPWTMQSNQKSTHTPNQTGTKKRKRKSP